MAKNIDFSTMQFIVEEAMRQSGLEGEVDVAGKKVSIENAWKESLTINEVVFSNPQNLQKIRDSIALGIVNALTAVGTSGSISSGNTQGNPMVDKSPNVVINGDGSSPKAARVTDEAMIDFVSDPKFMAWVTAVNGFIVACAGVVSPATASLVGTASTAYTTAGAAVGGFPPVDATSKITTGSDTVKIGG